MNPSEEHIAFYYHIGLALTQWANVEHQLSWIAACQFPKTQFQLVLAGYWAIENFRSKTAFVNSILIESDALAGTTIKEWAEIQAKAEGLAKKRNQLAHRHVVTNFKGTAGRRMMLLNRKSPRARKDAQQFAGAAYLRDIVGWRLEFFAFGMQLTNFLNRLSGGSAQLPKSLEQPQRPPTIAQIHRGIYDMASTPPKALREKYWGEPPKRPSAP